MDTPAILLRRWQTSLPERVSLDSELAKNATAYKWKAPYRGLVLREALFWRTFDALSQAQLLHEHRHTLGSRMLLRAALESVAVLAYFNVSTRQLIDGVLPFDEFDRRTRLLLLGSRDKNTKYESVNVLTILKHADKTYPGVLGVYNTLSESVHPNFEGVCFGYSKVDHARDETSFSVKLYEMWADRHDSLLLLIGTVFEHEYRDVWAPQQRLLEDWLAEHDADLGAIPLRAGQLRRKAS